jgi:hypothetical protein
MWCQMNRVMPNGIWHQILASQGPQGQGTVWLWTTGKAWSSVMPNEQSDAKFHLASNARFLGAREQFDSEPLARHGPVWCHMNRVMPNDILHLILASEGPGTSVTLNHSQGMVQCDAKWTGWCQMAFGIKCSLLRGQGTAWLWTTGKAWSSVMPHEQGDARWHLASNTRFWGARD